MINFKRLAIKQITNCIGLSITDKNINIFIDGKNRQLTSIELKRVNVRIKELEAEADADAKVKAIELHIYANYSQKTQAQDNGWVQNFTTKLKAGGVNDLNVQVVGFATSFLKDGKKLNEILAGVDVSVLPMYEKLVKVAVKNEWAYLVIQEGKKAIAENRKPTYVEFPKFD